MPPVRLAAEVDYLGIVSGNDQPDKLARAGLEVSPGSVVDAPLVTSCPVNLECRLLQILQFGEAPRINSFVIGEILLVHVRDDLWKNGVIQGDKLRAVGRMGEDFYCRTMDRFEMKRPKIGP